MKRDCSLLHNQTFDLLVCGGGIYGAWVAYDATLRGLKVAIVDQGDWASATSSASSKLIHGGLRYLESYDFKLVKKALSEREMLQKVAPYRVWPMRFGVPIYSDSRMGWFSLKLGLMIYDWLGRTGKLFRHQYLKRPYFADYFPFLKTIGLNAGFIYTDAQTDDARLVLELISGAMNAGAVCVNYCRVTEQLEEGGVICGVKACDQLTNIEQEVRAKQVVFAMGQWLSAADQCRDWCRLTKGVHLIMPPVMKNEEALLLTAKSDGRVFFMISWYGRTLLGTTDTDYRGDLNQVCVEAEDIAYLLAAANNYLDTVWTEADIMGSFAGTRVLKKSMQSDPSSVSRDWVLKTTSNGGHYSIGGKVTSARQDAACIVDKICEQLGVNASCATLSRNFPWMPQEDYALWERAIKALAVQAGIDEESIKWLIRRHGRHAVDIILTVQVQPDLANRIISSLPFILADLRYCAQNEMVIHLDDVLRRRMPLLILEKLSKDDLYRIATQLAGILDWSDTTISHEIDFCCKQYGLS